MELEQGLRQQYRVVSSTYKDIQLEFFDRMENLTIKTMEVHVTLLSRVYSCYFFFIPLFPFSCFSRYLILCFIIACVLLSEVCLVSSEGFCCWNVETDDVSVRDCDVDVLGGNTGGLVRSKNLLTSGCLIAARKNITKM